MTPRRLVSILVGAAMWAASAPNASAQSDAADCRKALAQAAGALEELRKQAGIDARKANHGATAAAFGAAIEAGRSGDGPAFRAAVPKALLGLQILSGWADPAPNAPPVPQGNDMAAIEAQHESYRRQFVAAWREAPWASDDPSIGFVFFRFGAVAGPIDQAARAVSTCGLEPWKLGQAVTAAQATISSALQEVLALRGKVVSALATKAPEEALTALFHVPETSRCPNAYVHGQMRDAHARALAKVANRARQCAERPAWDRTLPVGPPEIDSVGAVLPCGSGFAFVIDNVDTVYESGAARTRLELDDVVFVGGQLTSFKINCRAE